MPRHTLSKSFLFRVRFFVACAFTTGICPKRCRTERFVQSPKSKSQATHHPYTEHCRTQPFLTTVIILEDGIIYFVSTIEKSTSQQRIGYSTIDGLVCREIAWSFWLS